MTLNIPGNNYCPCGSGVRYLACCKNRPSLPHEQAEYEACELFVMSVFENVIKILDGPTLEDFRTIAIRQFMVILEIGDDEFERYLQSEFFTDLLIHWLIFLAPHTDSVENLAKDLDRPETTSLLKFYLEYDPKMLISSAQTNQICANTSQESRFFDARSSVILSSMADSSLSLFQIRSSDGMRQCVKDLIFQEYHFLSPNAFDNCAVNDLIFVGRLIKCPDFKLVIPLNGFLPTGKLSDELLANCFSWRSLLNEDEEFTITDLQVNLIQVLPTLLM